MGMSFGLENTSDAILEDIEISYDGELSSRPAFIRSRPKNELSRNVLIRRVTATMPFGDSLFSLGYGALENLQVSDSKFVLDVKADTGVGLRLVRQRRGQPIHLVNTDVILEGPGGSKIKRAIIFVPANSQSRLNAICEKCQVRSAGKVVELQIRSRKP
jgi:hypothetical protein